MRFEAVQAPAEQTAAAGVAESSAISQGYRWIPMTLSWWRGGRSLANSDNVRALFAGNFVD